MDIASEPARTAISPAQQHMTRKQIIARQKALRPQIREAKRRGDDEQARNLLAELRDLRVRLRRVRHEERAKRSP